MASSGELTARQVPGLNISRVDDFAEGGLTCQPSANTCA